MFDEPNEMKPQCETPQTPRDTGDATDLREALFNAGAVGQAGQIQVSRERIMSVHGILFDIDPDLLNDIAVPDDVKSDPPRFYETIVRPWLEREPVLAAAEVRDSGRGLHVIIRPEPAIELANDGDRERWEGSIKMIQCCVPSDPNAPAITALTRPIGSTNSKTGRKVAPLKSATPVHPDQIVEFSNRFSDAPFREMMRILFGNTRVSPCPVCRTEGSSLTGYAHKGKCYKCEESIEIESLFDVFVK